MSGEEAKAAMRRPPESLNGVSISVTSTADSEALPDHFPGCWVQVKCTAGECRILLGDAATSVDATAASGDADYGYPMAAGDKEDWELKDWHTHLAHDSTTTATLEVWINSGKSK